MTTMNINEINPFELTPVELKVFNDILLKKEVSAADLIKRLGIHKGTAYTSLRRLEEKGIVSFRKIEGISKYSISAIALKKKIEENNLKRKNISGQIQELIDIAKKNETQQESPKVELLLGHEGFKSFFNDLYRWANKTKKEYFFMGKGNEMIEEFGKEYYERTQSIKKRLKIKCRVIFQKSSLNLPVKNIVVGNVKYLDMPNTSQVSTWIYGNKVVIVGFGSKPLTTIIIDSKHISESYKNYFELLWKQN